MTGIRERTNQKPRNKTERRRSNNWAFYQLRAFLEYKGIKEGIELTVINPAYTSQTCNCCLHLGLRSNKSFKCTNTRCGWIGDADENGSKMIALEPIRKVGVKFIFIFKASKKCHVSGKIEIDLLS